MAEVRGDLHRHPEPSFEERRTAALVGARLRALGLAPRSIGATGLLADLEVPGAARRVLLRADLDALRMPDACRPGLRSETPGVAHACGHDAHTAMLLGAASLLVRHRDRLRASVRFVFQHAEECCPGGAIDFVRAGALDGVSAAYALHVIGDLSAGTVSLAEGATMASADEFAIRVVGRGGHAAAPHLAADPVPAASAATLALHSIVSRRVDPFTPAAISVCSIQGGTAFNVIPESVELRGTARALEARLRDRLEEWIREAAGSAAAAHGCAAEVDYRRGYPVTVNDPEEASRAREIAASLLGAASVLREGRRVLGAEDFAYFAEKVPSAYAFLGVRNERRGITASNHHPAFDVDEEVLPMGAALLCALAAT
ncbi:MAG TPA: amidohydrolase [Planctomycetota bacterium]|jgi:amidohydrolase|nr:amidohydrolase [Planctomycetota bacterium]